MASFDELQERHRRRIITAWLAHFSSCRFAARFSKTANQPDGRIQVAVVDPWEVPPDDLAALDAMLDQCAKRDQGGLLAFPGLEREGDVLRLLRALAQTGRWSMRVLDSEDVDPVRVQVTWKTEEGHDSQVMGLGPFITMPEPRRMPYVGLALWPGKKSTKDQTGVSFRDMPSKLEKGEHRKLIKATKNSVDLAWPQDRAGELFAFRLPRRVVGT